MNDGLTTNIRCDICGNSYKPSAIHDKKNHNGAAFVSIDYSNRCDVPMNIAHFSDSEIVMADRVMECCPKCMKALRDKIKEIRGENNGVCDEM